MNPVGSIPVVQRHDSRYVVQFPPIILDVSELDKIYELPFTRKWHPVYDKLGGVKGLETVRFSLISHRGCAGECSFCALYFHQGRIVQSRSGQSILAEARELANDDNFRGTITDIGGPTANLYQASCSLWEKRGFCENRKCLVPDKCRNLKIDYKKCLSLYRKIRNVPGIKHVFIGSGFRFDLLVDDESDKYLEEICRHHISGLMKVAPEHVSDKVLKIMNKAPHSVYEKFVAKFQKTNPKSRKKIFLVNYFITAHPGCGRNEARELANYLKARRIRPEQIQDFTPPPMTLSTCLYYTERDPFTGEKIYVPKTYRERKEQRELIQPQNTRNKRQNAKTRELKPSRRHV